MSQISVAVHSLGNIGQNVVQSIEAAPDMVCLGVVRTPASVGTKSLELRGLPDFSSSEALLEAKGKPEVVIICGPSRLAPEDAAFYLTAGMNTVDSFDIHDQIPQLVNQLQAKALETKRVAITAAGWDPGVDSVIRTLFEAMAPVGTTFTNFGRGRSMGHSVAARAIKGVSGAVAITIPIGGGRHSRLVYILPETGASQENIQSDIAADPYFNHDSLDVRFVKTRQELQAVADNSHGVLMERVGSSGRASNQRLSFDMRIDNPALTAQILVAAARATTKMPPGCYTLIDVPPVALLPGDRMDHIARLV